MSKLDYCLWDLWKDKWLKKSHPLPFSFRWHMCICFLQKLQYIVVQWFSCTMGIQTIVWNNSYPFYHNDRMHIVKGEDWKGNYFKNENLMQGKSFYTRMNQGYCKRVLHFKITFLMCIRTNVGQLLEFITNTHRLST